LTLTEKLHFTDVLAAIIPAAERWNAFYDGYRSGIAPDVFRFRTNIR